MIVLNVGGGASRQLPPQYDGWEQSLLDIDPEVKPDVCIDARELITLPSQNYDAVYCSHNLEHYSQFDAQIVLDGFMHVLKPGGKVEINVPNLANLMRSMLASNLDLNDVWYRTGQGAPITFHDVLYGWGEALRNGNPYYAHKCGFTPMSLYKALIRSGFVDIQIIDQGSNLQGIATCP